MSGQQARPEDQRSLEPVGPLVLGGYVSFGLDRLFNFCQYTFRRRDKTQEALGHLFGFWACIVRRRVSRILDPNICSRTWS